MQYRDIIAKWPTKRALAEEVGAKLKTVELWHFRNRIPASWWRQLIKAAAARQLPITSEVLVEVEGATKKFPSNRRGHGLVAALGPQDGGGPI